MSGAHDAAEKKNAPRKWALWALGALLLYVLSTAPTEVLLDRSPQADDTVRRIHAWIYAPVFWCVVRSEICYEIFQRGYVWSEKLMGYPDTPVVPWHFMRAAAGLEKFEYPVLRGTPK